MAEVIINKEDFPNNSNAKKMELAPGASVERPKLKTVVSGQVTKKRKSIGNTITQTLFGNDARSVVSYVIQDVLIPAAKSTIQEMVSGGIEMLLFGESGNRNRSSRRSGQSYVSYGNFYKDREKRNERSSSTVFRSLSRNKYEDVVIEDRGEAEDVISNLVELIDQYGSANLGDFYELVGMDADFSDNKYGWTNLSRATVNRVREGYVIVFPKPRPLD